MAQNKKDDKDVDIFVRSKKIAEIREKIKQALDGTEDVSYTEILIATDEVLEHMRTYARIESLAKVLSLRDRNDGC